jgi:hypothetical protein
LVNATLEEVDKTLTEVFKLRFLHACLTLIALRSGPQAHGVKPPANGFSGKRDERSP